MSLNRRFNKKKTITTNSSFIIDPLFVCTFYFKSVETNSKKSTGTRWLTSSLSFR